MAALAERNGAGTGYVSSIFADDMTWEIVGHSAASRRYASAAEFIAEVLEPFGARFSADHPFRPVAIRQVVAEGDNVAVFASRLVQVYSQPRSVAIRAATCRDRPPVFCIAEDR